MSSADVATPNRPHYNHSTDLINIAASEYNSKSNNSNKGSRARQVGAFPGIVEEVVALLSPENRPILLSTSGIGPGGRSMLVLESVLDALISCCTETTNGPVLPKQEASPGDGTTRHHHYADSNVIKRCVDAGAVEFTLDILISSTNGAACSTVPGISSMSGSGSFGLGSDGVIKDTVTWESKALWLLDAFLLTDSGSGSGPGSACSRALSSHSARAVANAIGKRLLRVSPSATASALSVLASLFRHSSSFRSCVSSTSAASANIPAKLVVILQVTGDDSTKRIVARLLRGIAREAKHTRSLSNGEPHSVTGSPEESSGLLGELGSGDGTI